MPRQMIHELCDNGSILNVINQSATIFFVNLIIKSRFKRFGIKFKNITEVQQLNLTINEIILLLLNLSSLSSM